MAKKKRIKRKKVQRKIGARIDLFFGGERGRFRSKNLQNQNSPGFHTTAREPKRAHFRVLPVKTQPKFNEKTQSERQREERNGGGRGKKERKILGCRAEGREGLAQGGRKSKPTTTTTTTCTTTANPEQVGPEVDPEGSTSLSPGLGFGAVGFWFWSECMSLGLLGFGLFGFRKFGQNTETLKLAKIGLAKVGQAHNWPKLVKELAKVNASLA